MSAKIGAYKKNFGLAVDYLGSKSIKDRRKPSIIIGQVLIEAESGWAKEDVAVFKPLFAIF